MALANNKKSKTFKVKYLAGSDNYSVEYTGAYEVLPGGVLAVTVDPVGDEAARVVIYGPSGWQRVEDPPAPSKRAASPRGGTL